MSIQNIFSVVPGMILDEDVLTDKGFKLLPKGIKLTENHISIMKQWGITEIQVSDSCSKVNLSTFGHKIHDDNIKIRNEIQKLLSSYDARIVIHEFENLISRFEFYNRIDSPEMTRKWSD